MHDPLPPTFVLCGGFGTRLRPVVADRPKVLAPIRGVPFLTILLHHLRASGVTEVVLSTGYQAEQLHAYVGHERLEGLRLRCVTEPRPLGTAGALRFARAEVGVEGPILALNGDTFFSGDLRTLVAFHRRASDAEATLALTRVPDATRFGAVRFEADEGRVVAVEEKGASGSAWINAGVYVLGPGALDGVIRGEPASLERDVFPALRPHLFACPFPDASFLDIGTPEDYARAATLLPPTAA